MLKEERSRIRKLIREEEDRLRLIDNELHGKKRKYSDVVVPEEIRAELERARARLVESEESKARAW